MGRQQDTLNGFNAVAPGQTATVDMGTGVRYHQIWINYKNNAARSTIESDIKEVRMKINGRVVRRFSAAELFVINGLNGQEFQNGYLPIFLSEPWRRNAVGEDAGAWGMSNVASFQIEVDIDAGATNPTLSGFAEFDAVQLPLTDIIMWEKQTVPANGSGTVTLNTLPRVANEFYQRFHCFEGADGHIKAVDVKVGRQPAKVLKDAENNAKLLADGYTPQSAVFPIVFDNTQRWSDALSMVKANGQVVSEFRLDFEMNTGATDFVLFIEKRGTPDNVATAAV